MSVKNVLYCSFSFLMFLTSSLSKKKLWSRFCVRASASRKDQTSFRRPETTARWWKGDAGGNARTPVRVLLGSYKIFTR